MNHETKQGMPTQRCPSDYAIDCHVFLSGVKDQPEVAAHLRTCVLCHRRLKIALETMAPSGVNDWQTPKPLSARRRYWVTASVLVAAASCALLVRPQRPQSSSERTKGGDVHLNVIGRSPEGRVRRLLSGEAVQPSERLRFEVVGGPGYAAVISIDSAGVVTPFLPAAGAAAPLTAGSTLLRGAVALDEVLGTERMLLAVCSHAFDVAAMVHSANVRLDAVAGQANDITKLTLPGDCRFDAFNLKKANP
ncbi:MAG: hypothetical protein SF187_11070 [Deltaproteobacteria bacterium]|nr:hypothetical protein [Deltaproteobacteria bacterium]